MVVEHKKEQRVDSTTMEEFHHLVILRNETNDTVPLAIGFADETDEIQCYVSLDLITAHKFGQRFTEVFNEALGRIRKDQ